MPRKWTDADIQLLREVWPHHMTSEVVAMFPQFSKSSVNTKASKLKLKRSDAILERIEQERHKSPDVGERRRTWTDEENALLREYWPQGKSTDVYQLLPHKSVDQIRYQASRLGLKYRDLQPWTTEEESLLTKHWPEGNPSAVFAMLPHRLCKNIRSKANKMGLRFKRKFTHDAAKAEAIKYRSKTELRRRDPALYASIGKRNHWDSICSHFDTNATYGYSQQFLRCAIASMLPEAVTLYNDRKTIKPLELDVYLPEYSIAFEYDGSRWHTDPEVLSRDRAKESECLRLGINLYRIKEVRNNRKEPEDFILEALTDFGFDVSSVNKQQCIEAAFDLQMSGDRIAEIVSKYSTLSEFCKEEWTLYRLLKRRKLIHKYLSDLARKIKRYTDEGLCNLLSGYETKLAFRLDHNSAYSQLMAGRNRERFRKSFAMYQSLATGSRWTNASAISSVA